MEVGPFFEVFRLEVVGPQNEDFVFADLGVFFFDGDGAGYGVVEFEYLVFVVVGREFEFFELFGELETSFGRPCHGIGFIDTTRHVAMSVCGFGWEFLKESLKGFHLMKVRMCAHYSKKKAPLGDAFSFCSFNYSCIPSTMTLANSARVMLRPGPKVPSGYPDTMSLV